MSHLICTAKFVFKIVKSMHLNLEPDLDVYSSLCLVILSHNYQEHRIS